MRIAQSFRTAPIHFRSQKLSHTKGVLFLSTLLLTFCLSISAQTDGSPTDEDVLEMEKVIITATRTEEELLDVPQHATVITEEEIRAMGASNLAEVIDEKAGTSISDFGPLGAQKSVSLRGSTTSQVLVLIDGVRTNNAQNGVVDLSLIPLDNIERIEIVRGDMSALYGADAVGGVINIITKREATKDYTVRIQVENGSYLPQEHVKGYGLDKEKAEPENLDLVDSQRISLQMSHDFGPLMLNSSGSFFRAQNGYIFKDLNNEDRKRQNAHFLGGDASLALRFPFQSGFVDVSGFYLKNNKGIPGKASSPTLNAEQSDQRVRGVLHMKTDHFFTDLVTCDINTYVSSSEIGYEDPDAGFDSLHRLVSTGGELVQELLLFESMTIIYGLNASYDTLDSTDVGERNRVYGGAFIETPLYLGERLILQPALRIDYYSDFEAAFGARLGAVYNITETLALKTSLSRSYRAPTFNDLYWPADVYAEGNPDLEPETGYSGEVGLTFMSEHLQWNGFLFARYIQDVILWQSGTDDIWRPSNYGEALYPGTEQHVRLMLLDHLTLHVSYTFLYTYVLSGEFVFSDNKRLPMIPLHEADFGFQYNDGKNMIYVNAHFETLRYLKTSNIVYLPSHFVVNVRYRRQLSDRVGIFLGADNLFGENYEVVPGYPMPGLMIRTGLEAEL